MLHRSLHGERTQKHPVHSAGGDDNIVLSGYIVYIVLDREEIIKALKIPLLTTRVIFRPPLLFLHELMNYARPAHMVTPEHDSIIAPVI